MKRRTRTNNDGKQLRYKLKDERREKEGGRKNNSLNRRSQEGYYATNQGTLVRTAKNNYAKKVSIYELETTTTGKTMARQEDAFIHTRTLDETLLVG